MRRPGAGVNRRGDARGLSGETAAAAPAPGGEFVIAMSGDMAGNTVAMSGDQAGKEEALSGDQRS